MQPATSGALNEGVGQLPNDTPIGQIGPREPTEGAASQPAPADGDPERDPENGSGSSHRRQRKLAEETALRIQRDITRHGWPVGTVIGSERDLLEKLGVSRAVFREAVRILEHHHSASTRPGPGGGLIVTEPDQHAILRAVSVYLDYKQVTAHHIYQARVALELNAIQLTCARLNEDGITRLRQAVADEKQRGVAGLPLHGHNMHRLIAELSANPALIVFVEVLIDLALDHTTVHPADPEAAYQRMHRAHAMIVEAIIQGDEALARHRMARHLAALQSFEN